MRRQDSVLISDWHLRLSEVLGTQYDDRPAVYVTTSFSYRILPKRIMSLRGISLPYELPNILFFIKQSPSRISIGSWFAGCVSDIFSNHQVWVPFYIMMTQFEGHSTWNYFLILLIMYLYSIILFISGVYWSQKKPLRHKYYAEQGCIRFEIEIHGLNPTLTEEAFKEISNAFNGRENGYLNNGLDNRDNYYMKRVYLGCVRSIDLLTSLPEWDGKNVIVQGGSQGGALALITTGLDPRVTACVANHPALSDMAGYKAGRAGGYPHFFPLPKGINAYAGRS